MYFLAISKLHISFLRNFPEDETGINILNAAKEILSEFKILQKVWIILTDNGSNIKLATRLLREEQNSELNGAEEPDWSKIEEQIDEGISINDNDNVQERDGKWNFRKQNVDLKPYSQPYSSGVHLSLKVALRNFKMVVFLKVATVSSSPSSIAL